MVGVDVVGVDGVLIHEIQGGVIFGGGEWNPPGGWQPFQLDLRTGEALETS